MLKVGTKIRARWTENFSDHVSRDGIYEVVEVSELGFYIINDKGEKCFPVSTDFICKKCDSKITNYGCLKCNNN